MTDKTFEIKGKFSKHGELQIFTKMISADSKDGALERMYCIVGSNHKVKRPRITVESIEEVKA